MKTTLSCLPAKNTFLRPFMWCITMVFWVFAVFPGWGQEALTPRIAILISKNIRPYLEATAGVTQVLSVELGAEIDVFPLEKYQGNTLSQIAEQLVDDRFRTVVGVGPEAFHFLEAGLPGVPLPTIYTMVLHTQKAGTAFGPECGIPLNIPVKMQLQRIKAGLPSIKRLGLLYDPAYNTPFSLEALIHARTLGMEVIPLSVSSKKEIPKILKSNWARIDGLWMIPDQTVISESIIQYVIKQALFNKRPVIGYNRFFYESGAALAFVFDYEELGRQTGYIAIALIEKGYCGEEPPVFHTWLNRRVLDRIGWPFPETFEIGIESGP